MHSDPNSQDWDYDFYKDEKDASFQKEKAKYDEFAESFKKKEKSNFWGGREQREKMEEDVFRNFQSMFNYEFKKKELKGEDLFLEVKISFYESYNGCLKAISIKNKRELCKTCKGSKCLPGFKPNKCLVCAGSGKYKSPLRGVIDCVTCKGKGILIKNFCK